MEERQVTVDGTPYPVPRPFLVHGHPEPGRHGRHLPAARGAARPLPDPHRHRLPRARRTRSPSSPRTGWARTLDELTPVLPGDHVEAMIRIAREVHVARRGAALRRRSSAPPPARCPRSASAPAPAAASRSVRAARAKAASAGRRYVVPEDVKAHGRRRCSRTGCCCAPTPRPRASPPPAWCNRCSTPCPCPPRPRPDRRGRPVAEPAVPSGPVDRARAGGAGRRRSCSRSPAGCSATSSWPSSPSPPSSPSLRGRSWPGAPPAARGVPRDRPRPRQRRRARHRPRAACATRRRGATERSSPSSTTARRWSTSRSPGSIRAAAVGHLPAPTARRGVVAVGPLSLGRSDAARPGRGSSRTTATSSPCGSTRGCTTIVPLPASMTRSLEGPTSDTAPSGTVTFHALREYVLGDDLRHVHWRSSAHTGELMVKHYVDTSLPDTTVVLDTSSAGPRRGLVRGGHRGRGVDHRRLDLPALPARAPHHRRPRGRQQGRRQRGPGGARPVLADRARRRLARRAAAHARPQPGRHRPGGRHRRAGRRRAGVAGDARPPLRRGRAGRPPPRSGPPLPALSGVIVVSGTTAADIAATWNRTFAR